MNRILAWEIEKGDAALDAGVEIKRLYRAIAKAHKAIGSLRDALQPAIKKHGNSYLDTLRQADAGIHSLHNIDGQVQRLGEDIAFIAALLTADVGPGELASSNTQPIVFPTRQEVQA
jgi:hypothetical protein